MSRPRLVSVDVEQRPPQMTLAFPGPPARYITVRMRTDVQTAGLARLAAQVEIEALTPRDVELLRESATAGPDLDVGSLALLEAAVRPAHRVASSGLPAHRVASSGLPVFCPGCCRRLGNADSPALGYLTRCSGCARALTVQRIEGWIVVSLHEPPAEPRHR